MSLSGNPIGAASLAAARKIAGKSAEERKHEFRVGALIIRIGFGAPLKGSLEGSIRATTTWRSSG